MTGKDKKARQWRHDARVLGSPPLAPKLLREFLLSLVGFWVAAPLCRTVGFWVAAPSLVPPLPGAGVPTDPQSPEGGSQWCRITRGGPTPRFQGHVSLITQSTLRNGGVGDADDPADFEATLLQLGLAISTSSLQPPTLAFKASPVVPHHPSRLACLIRLIEKGDRTPR